MWIGLPLWIAYGGSTTLASGCSAAPRPLVVSVAIWDALVQVKVPLIVIFPLVPEIAES